MTERCSGHQGQLIIWAAAEAHRLRRLADGVVVGPTAEAGGGVEAGGRGSESGVGVVASGHPV
ncbi:MAG: hypothetical protein M3011_08945 [Actinomycetota bacterium]|nr:hypothetical protein [Actinomycetota bacterium]